MNDTTPNSDHSDRKYYTLEEANNALPLVRSIVNDIVVLFGEVKDRQERLLMVRRKDDDFEPGADPYADEVAEIERGLEADIARLQGYANELQSLGVELKDPRTGLIDFYTKIDGRDAFLCWKMGEGDIAHWHELDAGFAGRQSLFEGSTSGDSGFNTGPSISLD